MKVHDVLASKGSSEVFTIAPDATVSELLDLLAELNVGALIVSRDGSTLDGIVSERDIVRKLRGTTNARETPVADIMTTDVRACAPDDSFTELMGLRTEHRIRHVPVLDGDQVVGVLSIGDAVKQRMTQLEFERDQLTSYVAGG